MQCWALPLVPPGRCFGALRPAGPVEVLRSAVKAGPRTAMESGAPRNDKSGPVIGLWSVQVNCTTSVNDCFDSRNQKSFRGIRSRRIKAPWRELEAQQWFFCRCWLSVSLVALVSSLLPHGYSLNLFNFDRVWNSKHVSVCCKLDFKFPEIVKLSPSFWLAMAQFSGIRGKIQTLSYELSNLKCFKWQNMLKFLGISVWIWK